MDGMISAWQVSPSLYLQHRTEKPAMLNNTIKPNLAAMSMSFQPRMWFQHDMIEDSGETRGSLMWVYIPAEEFCDDKAAARVNWLNGGKG